MGACGSTQKEGFQSPDAPEPRPKQQPKPVQNQTEPAATATNGSIMGPVGSLGPLSASAADPAPASSPPPTTASAAPTTTTAVKQPKEKEPSRSSAAQPTAANTKNLQVTVQEESSVSTASVMSPSAVAFHNASNTPQPPPSVSNAKSPISQQPSMSQSVASTRTDSVDLDGVKLSVEGDAIKSPHAGVKLPSDDKSERIFDVPTLDANTLMSFACERLQVCYSNPAQLNTPALQARRAEPETVALEALRKLRFRSDGIQENARKDLVPAMTEVLRALTMENTKVHLLEICGIPADATLMRALSVVIRANKGLGILSLHLAKEGHTTLKSSQVKIAQELCQSLQFNKRLLNLDLSSTYLGAAEGAILADLINYNTSLLHLNLSRTGLGAAGGHIAAMIQLNTSLISIDLSGNDFGDTGGRGIAHALSANATLTKLDLGENNLTASTVLDLSKFLQGNRVLKELSLRDNDLGVPGGNALSGFLKVNRTITSLNLNGCNLGIFGGKWLSKALEMNHVLSALNLAYNDLQYDGTSAICIAIRSNTTLIHIDFTGNNIGEKGSKLFKSLLKINQTLQTLPMVHNEFKIKHMDSLNAMLDSNCANKNHIAFSPRTILFPVDFGRTVDLKTHLVLRNTASKSNSGGGLSVTNKQSPQPLTFQIVSTVPSHHIIYPSMGFIQPGASVAIRIRLRGRFAKEYCRHSILVRTLPVDAEATKSSAASFWNERTGQGAKEGVTFLLRCDWSLSGSGSGQHWTPQLQETVDAHVYQSDQRTRGFDEQTAGGGSAIRLTVPTISSLAQEGLKADREKLVAEIHALRTLLATQQAKDAEKDIELAELAKKETKLQADLAKARAKSASKKSGGVSGLGGGGGPSGEFDVSDLFFDGDEDDDLLLLGLGRSGSHRAHRRRQRRRDEDLLDLLGESSGSGSGEDLFEDDEPRGRRGGKGGKGSGSGTGTGNGTGTGTGTGGSGNAAADTKSPPSASTDPAAPPPPGAIPSFAPTRKPIVPAAKKNNFAGGGDDSEDEAKKSESEDEPEEKKSFVPDANVVSGGGAPMAPPMDGSVPMAPPIIGSGAPPPPPMAPGMGPSAQALPGKKAIKPGVEMRKLHWAVVGASDVSGTLWKELDDSDVMGDNDLKEFEAAFGAAAPAPGSGASFGASGRGGGAGGGSGGSVGGGKKKKSEDEDKIVFVDPKRSFNLDITLSRFRITHEQIREALLSMDDSILTEEKVDALLKFAPLPEEIKALKKFTGDPTKLGKSEQYLRIVSTIPRLTERLELILFKMQYPDLSTGIETALNYVDQARVQIKESNHLRQVLKIVLAFGNYMNGGTRNGQAYGFQLETLTKLRSAKSTDNSSNLLNFLVSHIQKKHPEVSSFITDLSAVKMACRVESSHVMKQVQRMQKHLKQLHKELKKAEELESTGQAQKGDRFLLVMKEFYASAVEKSKSLEKRQEQLEKDCKELATFFGAKHITKWEDLFQIFDDFLADYQSAERFLEAVRIREEAKARREQAAALAKPARGRTQSESVPGGGLSLAEQMAARRASMAGAGSTGVPASASASPPATIAEDNGVDLGEDSDWESD